MLEQTKQKNAHLSKHRSTHLYEVVAFGHKVLRMSDASMARELCVSKQRVSQIRSELGYTAIGRIGMSIKDKLRLRIEELEKENTLLKSTLQSMTGCSLEDVKNERTTASR